MLLLVLPYEFVMAGLLLIWVLGKRDGENVINGSFRIREN
jgi:hypothetical protein